MTKPKPKSQQPKTHNGKNANLVRSTAFKKGTPRPANAGRKKGQRNRTTQMLKDAILEAATIVGRDGKGKDGLVGYLAMLAVKEKAVYARLLEKVLPLQLNVKDDGPKRYTAEEVVRQLQERKLPVPSALLQIASSVVVGVTMEQEYADELDGVGFEDEEVSTRDDA